MTMPFYLLDTTMKQGASVKKTRPFVVSSGLRHVSYPAAAKAARVISKAPGVARVTMTRVHEESEGVWRNGRKS